MSGDAIEPPFISGAGSPWPWRPITLCADRWPDGDNGPPWGPRPAVMDGEIQADV